MNTEMNYHWQMSKKHLVALSCATALATFTLVARPTFADEVKASDTNAKTEVVAPAIENVVATVETKTLDENPTATTTDAPTGTSIITSEATSVTTDTTAIPETPKPASNASSTVISETISTRSEIPTSKTGATVSETASMENARYEDISENRLKTLMFLPTITMKTQKFKTKILKKILQVVNGIVTYKVVGTTKKTVKTL